MILWSCRVFRAISPELFHLVSLLSSLISVPEATGPLVLDIAPDSCAEFVVSIRFFAPVVIFCLSNVLSNQFALLREEAGSPMSSVMSVLIPRILVLPWK